jgi:hypothetical protein
MGFMRLSATWEACSYSASQDTLNILANLKLHYRIYISQLLVPSYVLKINFNITLLLRPGLLGGLFP